MWVAREMIERIGDEQLRHRIYQADLRGMQIAIYMNAKVLGVPVIYKPPQGTSSYCPLHNAPIIYNNGSRVGSCSKRGEKWPYGCCICMEPPSHITMWRWGHDHITPHLEYCLLK